MQTNKVDITRLRTISCIENKVRLDPLTDNNTDKESCVNITVNNHLGDNSECDQTLKKLKKRGDNKYRRQKTDLIATPQESITTIISRLITKNVHNVNININYNNIEQRRPSVSQGKRNTTTLWKKTLNASKMVNAFLHPSVIKIEDNEIFNDTLKKTLLGAREVNKLSTVVHHEVEISLSQFLRKTEVEKEFIRVSLKERALKLITEGASNTETLIQEFDKLFNLNPEKTRYSTEDKHFLFNQHLSNGKTLLYIACQEGSNEIVDYLLSKDINLNIKVSYYDMEDTCIGVSCRWNYYDIAQKLLQTNKIDQADIVNTLEKENCNNKIKSLLLDYLPRDHNRKRGCGCF